MSEQITSGVVYLVQEVNWRYNDMWYYCDEDDGPIGWPTQAFTSRAKAEAHRREKEREARQGENPFGYGGDWSERSTAHDSASLLALVRELGLSEPHGYDGNGEPGGVQDWENWWAPRRMTGEQAERFWDALDKVIFYEVIELPLAGGRP